MFQPSPYPKYTASRHEQVTWFARPLLLGTNQEVPGQQIVALGISNEPEGRTVDCLIVDVQGQEGQRPLKLGRLWKFAPSFDLVVAPAALQQLAATYGLVVPATT